MVRDVLGCMMLFDDADVFDLFCLIRFWAWEGAIIGGRRAPLTLTK